MQHIVHVIVQEMREYIIQDVRRQYVSLFFQKFIVLNPNTFTCNPFFLNYDDTGLNLTHSEYF